MSVPNGYLGEGLPVGLQFLGRAWDEEVIVRYGYAYEQATRYRHPPPATPPLATAVVKLFIGTWKLIAIRDRDDGQGHLSLATPPRVGEDGHERSSVFVWEKLP